MTTGTLKRGLPDSCSQVNEIMPFHGILDMAPFPL